MNEFKKHIVDELGKHVDVEIELEVPPDPKLGDYAFPCFSLAKQYRKSPHGIAADLTKKVKKGKYLEKVVAEGPYLNFFVNKKKLAEVTIKKVLDEKDRYGSSNAGKKRKLILEHTSINPNASPHVGRARNALIGDSLARILRFQNYNVEVHYFVNDIGKQIATLVLGARKKKAVNFKDLLKVYTEISREVEKNESLEKEALQLLHKLENGDKKVRGEFKKVVKTAVEGQKRLFSKLGIKYDVFDYESDYLWSKKTRDALDLLKKTGRFYFDKDNRIVLDLKGFGLGMKMPVMVLTRSDGTSLYSLRDVAYALDLTSKGDYIVVLGEDQKLYNEQVNSALLLLEKRPRKAVHYSFVLLEESKMSTRKGNLVLLEDFMEQAAEKAGKELRQRYDKVDTKTAESIGFGALKYAILKVGPEKNVNFSWQSALSFEGEAAPYIQYAYARVQSIIRKHGKGLPKSFDAEILKEPEEFELAKKIAFFPDVVEKAGRELRPNIIASYSYELAKQFSEFYHRHNILKEEKNVMSARLSLSLGVAQTLKNALKLLGVDVLERM